MSQTQEATRAGSIDSRDSNTAEPKKAKSRRPANTAFRQQRLKAWQPILTPKTVLPLFFAVGIIFAPIGGLLLYASAQVQEIVIDYSECIKTATDEFAPIPAGKVSALFKPSNSSTSANPPTWKKGSRLVSYVPGVDVPTDVCSLQFHIPVDIGPPVLLYYRLSNFFQNHRRYVKSLDAKQLKGDSLSNSTIDKSLCDPLRLNGSLKDGGFAIYPCGLIANSMFNDSYVNPVLLGVRQSSADNKTYSMSNKNIAWESDKALYEPTKYRWDEVAPPPNWMKRYPQGYTEDNPPPDLKQNEAFQVWMRTAGLPTFSKLALRNDNEKMVEGRYQLDIEDNFPVTEYGGTKSIVISTRTVMGGRNPFLGIAYVVVGGICVVLGALFTATHLIKPRKLGDHTYLTWNDDQPSTATTSGREARPGANDGAA
ncbi:MAG: hypothetical protein M1832_003890 [Thelocarpon impressellum]|nr:MAG: hypothetical protein M1832_003890 [Thelocarpon impressellum]